MATASVKKPATTAATSATKAVPKPAATTPKPAATTPKQSSTTPVVTKPAATTPTATTPKATTTPVVNKPAERNIAAELKAAVNNGASTATINALIAERDAKVKSGNLNVMSTADYLKSIGYVPPAAQTIPTPSGFAANPSGSIAPVYQPDPAPVSGQEMAKQYDINYDENAILGKLRAASQAEYAALRNEYDTTANKFYDQTASAQDAALDTIRKSNAKAVATGASRGMQAANELSSILGLEQTVGTTATQLAADRNLLMDKEQAAYAQNVVDAQTTANALKNGIMTAANNRYATDTQLDVGKMQYYAQLDAAAKALEGNVANADANRYSAEQSAGANRYAADQNRIGQNAYAQAYQNAGYASAGAMRDAAGISAAATQNAAGIAANATRDAAATSAAAQTAYYQTQTPKDLAITLNGYITTGNKNAFVATMRNSGLTEAETEKLWAESVSAGKVPATKIPAPAPVIPNKSGKTSFSGVVIPPYDSTSYN